MTAHTASDRSTQQVPTPDLVRVQCGAHDGWQDPATSGVDVTLSAHGDGMAVEVSTGAVHDALSRIHLRWRRPPAIDALVLGDAWERSYGDLQWAGVRPERVMPWMVLIHSPGSGVTWGAGVDVRGGSFASWTVDADGVSLWLDVRAGSQPVALGTRTMTAAVVRWIETTERPFVAQRHLTAALCRDPLLSAPIVGANNWYYAYGKGFDVRAVVGDARLIAELAGDHPVRPFGVIDDGWSPDGMADGRPASGGPWDTGRRPQFGDMAAAAGLIVAEGVRPGIWFRPLLRRLDGHPGTSRPWDGGFALDPSHPATLETVAADVRRLHDWGYELIKHDFSTFEALGRWGNQMLARPAADSIAPWDRSRSTAEVLVELYRAIHTAAGDALVLGCNTIGHLAAGLEHAHRSGDDTSGRSWDRTRQMGVNTLAFRLAQHRTFFALDPDCAVSTTDTPWSLNRQYLDLVARSGTALFVSVDPATRTDVVDQDLPAALRLALDGGAPGGVEPVDWLRTTTPQSWRSGGDVASYGWFGPAGADPFGGLEI